MTSIAQALAEAARIRLDRIDAQLLLLHALGRSGSDRAWLLAHDGDVLAPTEQDAFSERIRRRANGEPVAYILGRKEFFGLDLVVDPRVLVPRPDTETLVDWALAVIPALTRDPGAARPWIADQARNDLLSVIDLGTGSGAIALAIKSRCSQAQVEATDNSPGALEVARGNAGRLGLDIAFRGAAWLGGAGRYDLIVSNPPYVAQGDPHLAALAYEPITALAAGPDGLRDIRAIVSQAPSHLHPGGWLLLEHGYDQADAVRCLLAAAGFRSVSSRRDLSGIERCSGGQWLELG
ncbi:MAG: peptide chain release factor N(5)-glutamine methyltransferase [Ramlibacter sp.]